MSTGPGRMRAGPGPGRFFKLRAGPNLGRPGRPELFYNLLGIFLKSFKILLNFVKFS